MKCHFKAQRELSPLTAAANPVCLATSCPICSPVSLRDAATRTSGCTAGPAATSTVAASATTAARGAGTACAAACASSKPPGSSGARAPVCLAPLLVSPGSALSKAFAFARVALPVSFAHWPRRRTHAQSQHFKTSQARHAKTARIKARGRVAEVALEDAAATPQGAAVPSFEGFVLATGLHRHRGPQGHSARKRHSRPKRRLQAIWGVGGAKRLNPSLTVEGGAEGLPRPRPLKQDHCAAFHYEVCPPPRLGSDCEGIRPLSSRSPCAKWHAEPCSEGKDWRRRRGARGRPGPGPKLQLPCSQRLQNLKQDRNNRDNPRSLMNRDTREIARFCTSEPCRASDLRSEVRGVFRGKQLP